MIDNEIYELLVIMEMRYQYLGANLVDFLDVGFDPDAYYTPCENAMYRVYEHLGFKREDIVSEAYRRIKDSRKKGV